MVKIRLQRFGRIRTPHYRIVIAEAKTRRNGKAIEVIGRYVPGQDPSLIEVNSARAQYWLGVGAQASEPVLKLLKITGDWQKFKGLPGVEGTLKVAPAKPDKRELFEAALKAADQEPSVQAFTQKKSTKNKKAAADQPANAESKNKDS